MLTLGHILEALTGQEVKALAQPISQVVIDSRQATAGALFVALPGEKADGHAFVGDAFSRGAIAALVMRLPEGVTCTSLDLRDKGAHLEPEEQVTLPVCLIVADPLAALQQAAAFWRARFNPRVIGITGSVGKTTTKELVAEVLAQRYRTLKSEASHNNEIGLPLTLLRLTPADQRVVVEMGMYTRGEIAHLAAIARPHVGVVTNIGPVHLERAGSMEAIIKAKTELVEALPPAPEGVAILNYDDEHVRGMAAATHAHVFFYGLDPAADLWADEIESQGLQGIRFRLHFRNEALNVRVPLLGQHSVHTALRATAVGLVEGLTWEEIVRGLQATGPAQVRLVAVPGPGGATILDDTYNASPASMIAALNLLDELDGRKIAVLGDMLELGSYEQEGHKLVGRRARDVAHILITVGQRARMMAEAARDVGMPSERLIVLEDVAEAIEVLRPLVSAGDVVLIKGSRALHMERIVAALGKSD
jgi:UDP-N-acetylmuramoyl-tripeptide--D-alanyl-D-alanine ligase